MIVCFCIHLLAEKTYKSEKGKRGNEDYGLRIRGWDKGTIGAGRPECWEVLKIVIWKMRNWVVEGKRKLTLF